MLICTHCTTTDYGCRLCEIPDLLHCLLYLSHALYYASILILWDEIFLVAYIVNLLLHFSRDSFHTRHLRFDSFAFSCYWFRTNARACVLLFLCCAHTHMDVSAFHALQMSQEQWKMNDNLFVIMK